MDVKAENANGVRATDEKEALMRAVMAMKERQAGAESRPEQVRQSEKVKQPEIVKHPEMITRPEIVKHPEMSKQLEVAKQFEMGKQPENAKQSETGAVYIQTGIQWKETLQKLEAEIEKELGRANAVVADVIAKEREKCKADLEAQYAQKDKSEIAALEEQHKNAMEAMKAGHQLEMEKLKQQYEQQINELNESFRDKTQQLRKDIDQYKERIEMLMLNIDDPFVIQEMQMKQDQEARQAAHDQNEAAEGAQQPVEQ